MTVYYIKPKNQVGAPQKEEPSICFRCPPRWLPGTLAVVGGFVGSAIGNIGYPSATRQGMATLLGGVVGLASAYLLPLEFLWSF